ncbi:NAD(P)/FAD-dependent oxidoreductase [Paenibacillus sp. IB182496]|uniref:NAD(P)/FAD-dependent oxidoreductase n=1 Tax=Paenibacillus sabuli TaxID=2772509 RepID=A0A927BRZ0_9BACL|nr:NAD(P)/FAD-dependent oxidoreductase [Paenibacillus sabuli]MBD2844821.1 NAD(P)/FAD-dependent oxidoreductase [Paenibacillus sabuli]
MPNHHPENVLDAVIVGGGPAGLSAALVLGRARKHVAVIDEGKPRNAVTGSTHGFLTRDPIPPQELRRIAAEQLGQYPSVRLVADTVSALTGSDGAFAVTTAQGQTYRARKVLLAAGMKDAPLPIPGLAEVYGRSAFVCPFCDGWELRERPLAVLAKGGDAMHLLKLLKGWSETLALCTNGPSELTDEQKGELAQRGIPVYEAPIARIDSRDGQARGIALADGTEVACKGIFFRSQLVPGAGLAEAAGCAHTEHGAVEADATGQTSVPGIYSAGDAASASHQAIAAAASGSMAGAGITFALNAEAWQRAGGAG